MKIISEELLDSVSAEAKSSSRLRMNHNFHLNLDDKVQKMLNALEPGTELPIHRHKYTAETYILLRGRIVVFFYNDQKVQISSTELSHELGCYGVDIPAGQWHTLEVLEPGTVIFEVKEGPYQPLNPTDIQK